MYHPVKFELLMYTQDIIASPVTTECIKSNADSLTQESLKSLLRIPEVPG